MWWQANPHVFRRLLANRPNCVNVNALIGPELMNGTRRVKDQRLKFASLYRPVGMLKNRGSIARDWETGISGVVTPTSEKTVLRDENATIKFARANGVQVEFKMLPLEQFSVLFKRHGFTTIDMLSIEHASSDRSASSHTQTESDSLRMYLLCTPCARRHGALSWWAERSAC
jgi:hypothetical protein